MNDGKKRRQRGLRNNNDRAGWPKNARMNFEVARYKRAERVRIGRNNKIRRRKGKEEKKKKSE